LEDVFPADRAGPRSGCEPFSATQDSQAELARYQKLVAKGLSREGAGLRGLLAEHDDTAFGIRALAYLCLDQEALPPEAPDVACRLYDFEQYSLACILYQRMEREGTLAVDDLIRYGSAVSECSHDLPSANRGLELTQRAFDRSVSALQGPTVTKEAIREAFKCYQSLAGLLLWKWLLTNAPADLDAAVQMLSEVEKFVRSEVIKDECYAIGRVAQMHLRSLLMLRIRDQNRERFDAEGHRDAILRLAPTRCHNPREVSYLRWYKAIAMADAGDAQGMSQTVVNALLEDSKLASTPSCRDIGRRQYTLLRRFIEHHLHVLRNHHLVGQVSRHLQQQVAYPGNDTRASEISVTPSSSGVPRAT
jgi:hypothetical protein